MTLDRDQMHISRVLEWFDRYRVGDLDIEGLQHNIAVIEGAIEGDVPSGTRRRIDTVHEMLELVRFGSKDHDDVIKIIRTMERQIDHDIRLVSGDVAICSAPDWNSLWDELEARWTVITDPGDISR